MSKELKLQERRETPDLAALLADLDEKEAKATKGPWEANYAYVYGPDDGRGNPSMVIYDEGGHDEHDAALIAALRNAYPQLRAALSAPPSPGELPEEPNMARLLDNAATCSQHPEMLEDDANPVLRECVQLNVYEPMKRYADLLRSQLSAALGRVAEAEDGRKAYMARERGYHAMTSRAQDERDAALDRAESAERNAAENLAAFQLAEEACRKWREETEKCAALTGVPDARAKSLYHKLAVAFERLERDAVVSRAAQSAAETALATAHAQGKAEGRAEMREEAAKVCDKSQREHGPLAAIDSPWEQGYEAAERVLAADIRALPDSLPGREGI